MSSSGEGGKGPRIWGGVPLRNPHFTGRDDLLGQLERRLSEAAAQLPAVLHGMGGIGKSQTVVEYIHRYAHEYDIIWWISAEEAGDIRKGLAALAHRLEIVDGGEEAVLRELEKGDRRWILVFDNAGPPSEVRPFLPAGGGHVVVTSRSAEWEPVSGGHVFPDGTYVICVFDLEKFGAGHRTQENRMAIRRAMHEAVKTAFERVGIPWKASYRRDGGDGILIAVPSVDANKGVFVGELLDTLTDLLDEHNGAHPDEVVKLRLALHVGEIAFDSHGPDGPGIIHANRLSEAAPLKAAHAQSTRPLAVITSAYVHTEVVKQHKKYAPNEYRRVPVRVKETDGYGWVRIPGDRFDDSLWGRLRRAVREFFGKD